MGSQTRTSWIKNNPFVAAAVVLPLLVVAFFLAATVIPAWLVDDPRFDLVFAVDHHDRSNAEFALRYHVRDGVVMAEARALPTNNYGPYQRLYRFDAASQLVSEITPRIPEPVRLALRAAPEPEPAPGDNAAISEQFAVAEVAQLRLITATIGPDGYTFNNQYNGHRGLFANLFGVNGRYYQFGISKQGRTVRVAVPAGGNYYYRNASFLGWVSDE